MKTAGLVVTVGTRDLQLEEKIEGLELVPGEEGNCFYLRHPRSIGEFLTSATDASQYVQKFRYPIIRPSLRHITDRGFRIKWILFVVTDQIDANESFRSRDTLFYSVILERLVRCDFADFLSKDTEFIHLKVERNVAFLDSMFDFFNTYFSEGEHYKGFQDTEKIFYCGQGGLDTVNTALLLNLIEFFPSNLVQLQKNAGVDFAIPLKFTGMFHAGLRKKIYEKSIAYALQQYDYSLLVNAIITSKSNPEYHIAEYAYARKNLDFETARIHLQQLLTIDLERRDIYLNWNREIAPDKTETNVQKELFMSAMISCKQGAYSDYLWRIFTLEENLLKPLIEKILGGKIQYDEKSDHAEWMRLIQTNEKLISFLEAARLKNDVPLKYKAPGRIVYRHIYNYFFPEGHPDRIENISNLLDMISVLSGLRNDIAHSMKGVSKRQIERKLNGKKISDFNALLFTFFRIKENTLPPYDAANELIREFIR